MSKCRELEHSFKQKPRIDPEEFIKSHQGLMRSLAQEQFFAWFEHDQSVELEDVYMDLCELAVRSSRKFDPDHPSKASFATYFRSCAKNNFVKRLTRGSEMGISEKDYGDISRLNTAEHQLYSRSGTIVLSDGEISAEMGMSIEKITEIKRTRLAQRTRPLSDGERNSSVSYFDKLFGENEADNDLSDEERGHLRKRICRLLCILTPGERFAAEYLLQLDGKGLNFNDREIGEITGYDRRNIPWLKKQLNVLFQTPLFQNMVTVMLYNSRGLFQRKYSHPEDMNDILRQISEALTTRQITHILYNVYREPWFQQLFQKLAPRKDFVVIQDVIGRHKSFKELTSQYKGDAEYKYEKAIEKLKPFLVNYLLSNPETI